MEFILKAIIMGIVEGITEFVPISSTGHLIIAGQSINFQGKFADLFIIVIQLGAILAVVLLYWKRIRNSLLNLMPGRWGFKFWSMILVAFIPSAVAGILLSDYIEKYLFNTTTVAIAMILGGLLLYYTEKAYNNKTVINDMVEVNAKQALKIGLFQCLSLFPGMSRSASTIIGGMASNLSTVAAAEFSFFLAIPTMIAASGYSLIKKDISMTNIETVSLCIGFVVSFITAILVVDKFIGYLKRKPLKIFAVYRVIAGMLLLVLTSLKRF